MASIAAFQNHLAPGAQLAASGTGLAAHAAGSTSASTISSNDFLTLLVTELKNQDPTANSDPNQYVNQLVQVNSLEQLIQINQTLTAQSSAGSGGSKSSGNAAPTVLESAPQSSAPSIMQPAVHAISNGNLSTPAENPAARRIAQALGGKAAHIQ